MNKEQLELLKSGVNKWNQWRDANQDIVIDLSNADLSNADLSNADLSWSDLSESDLRGSNLIWSDLRKANLSGANLSGSDLSESDLRGSNLRGSVLMRSNLSGSDLRWSNLRWSDLRGSNLSGSVLRRSNLSGSDLSEANLDGAHINWISNNLVSEILLRQCDTEEYKKHALTIRERTDLCYEDFLKIFPGDFIDFGVKVLARYVKDDDVLPEEFLKLLKERGLK